MRVIDTYGKSTIVKYVIFIIASFVLGFFGYIAFSLLASDRYQNEASSAAWQQVSVTVPVCNCVAKLVPAQPKGGNGALESPFTTYNNIPIIAGVNGVASFTVTDQNNNTIFTHNKTSSAYEEIRFDANLLDGVGLYKLEINMSGGSNYARPIWVEFLPTIPTLPSPEDPDGSDSLLPPDPPNTGYLYLAGSAFNLDGALVTGSVTFFFALIAVTGLVCLRYFRHKSDKLKAKATKPNNRLPKDFTAKPQKKQSTASATKSSKKIQPANRHKSRR